MVQVSSMWLYIIIVCCTKWYTDKAVMWNRFACLISVNSISLGLSWPLLLIHIRIRLNSVTCHSYVFSTKTCFGCTVLSFAFLFLAHLSRRLKVRYCDHSPSVVVVVVVRLSVRPSVRPFTIFKQHLLLNHWLDFDQISQEWSLVGPLSKLFKWFRSIAYLGHRS